MWAMDGAAGAALVTAVLLVTGCGNNGSSGAEDDPVSTRDGETSTGPAPERVRPCHVAQIADIEALVEVTVTAGPNPTNAGDGCEWRAEVAGEGDERSSNVVDLQVQDPSVALADALVVEGTPTPVEGFGTEALVEVSTAGLPAVMVGYRDTERVVTLRYEVQSAVGGVTDPRTRADQAVELLRIVRQRIATPG